MDLMKKAIWGPNPKEQFRKCQQALRKNKRLLDRQIQDLNNVEKKSKSLIKAAAKKGDMKAARLYARELQNTKKVNQRMHVSKATLNSIEMKLNEQQQLIKLTGSLQKSTGIMKDMNQLVRLPQISRTVQELSKELTKSGIIDEMVSDMLDTADWEEDDVEEDETVDEILSEVLGDQNKLDGLEVPQNPVEEPPSQVIQENEGENELEDDDEDLILDMRQRLNALQG